MERVWLKELQHYAPSISDRKIFWLSKLIYFLSMMARDTYDVGTPNVIFPQNLRKYNELIHRVASAQISLLKQDEKRMPDDVFFSFLEGAFIELNINVENFLSFMKSS